MVFVNWKNNFLFLVDEFKVIVMLKNVIDNFIFVDWMMVDIGGVDVYYVVIFNNMLLLSISFLFKFIINLLNGEF